MGKGIEWYVEEQISAGDGGCVKMMRLDKYLAEMGVGTRQEVKKQIRQGKVTVNGDGGKKQQIRRLMRHAMKLQ